VHIRVNKLRPVYFPNIFKPEGAEQYGNDHFTGYSGPAAEKINLLRIYDRWGSLIFEKKDFQLNEPNFGWDGTNNGQKVNGVFTWYALVGFIDGQVFPYEGDITVLR
jgi:gliding motility-associated-like protein